MKKLGRNQTRQIWKTYQTIFDPSYQNYKKGT